VLAGDLGSVGIDYSSASGAFDTRRAGSGKTVAVGGLFLTGSKASNYVLAAAFATADISQATLTVSAVGINKIYDGSTVATVTVSDDRIGADVLTISYAAAFDSADVGTARNITVSGLTLSGDDAG